MSLRDLAAHAEHIAQLVGEDRAALGTDLDGGVGREDTPREINSIADLPTFGRALTGAGCDRATVEGIMHGNWLRVLKSLYA